MKPIAADMDGTSVTNPESPTANHRGGQNVLFFDFHVAWKSVNTWDNAGKADNYYDDDHHNHDNDDNDYHHNDYDHDNDHNHDYHNNPSRKRVWGHGHGVSPK
jgi:hypothetical protein